MLIFFDKVSTSKFLFSKSTNAICIWVEKSSLAQISNLIYVSRYTDIFQTLARVNRLRMYTLQKLEVNA